MPDCALIGPGGAIPVNVPGTFVTGGLGTLTASDGQAPGNAAASVLRCLAGVIDAVLPAYRRGA